MEMRRTNFRFDFDVSNRISHVKGENEETPLMGGSIEKKSCWSWWTSLNRYEQINYVACSLHLVQAIYGMTIQNLNVMVDEHYVHWGNGTVCEPNSTVATNGFILTRTSAHTHDISLKWLIVMFHFLSFIFELAVNVPYTFEKGWGERYRDNIEKGTNCLRFVEYSASASIMLIAIALVSGIYGSYALIGIGFLTFVTMVLGGVAEQLFSDALPKMEKSDQIVIIDENITELKQKGKFFNEKCFELTYFLCFLWCCKKKREEKNKREEQKKKTNMQMKDFPLTYHLRRLGWVCHFTGWVTMLSAYGMILRNFAFAIEKVENDVQPPWFVYVIVIAIFILYNGFGLVQFLQLCNKTRPTILCYSEDLGSPSNKKLNRCVELVYVTNSLVSKTLLGLMITTQLILADTERCSNT
tara:strand:- start:3421 stop:4656 length:1236 start_codon:yes stop_codon:yes gene_type:complete